MSMRPLIYPVTSIRTLINAVGSNDATLVGKMVTAYRASYERDGGAPDEEMIAERRVWGRSLVAGTMANDLEPSDWTLACELAATALGLSDGMPVNEDWKWFAWCDYEELVQEKLAERAAALLHYLVEGRPFKGASQEGNGVYHAWLERAEIETLRAALQELGEAEPEINDEIDGFHNELIGWLEACAGRDLLLVAM